MEGVIRSVQDWRGFLSRHDLQELFLEHPNNQYSYSITKDGVDETAVWSGYDRDFKSNATYNFIWMNTDLGFPNKPFRELTPAIRDTVRCKALSVLAAGQCSAVSIDKQTIPVTVLGNVGPLATMEF
jgi:hypothetical protein